MIAFKDYNFRDGIWNSPWVGLDHFHMLFSNPGTVKIIRNTLFLSFFGIVFGFPFPIIIALLLKEIRRMWYKRIVQTLIYLPHFLSWIIVGGMVITVFSQEAGIVNHIMKWITGSPYPFLYKEPTWLAIFFGSGIWKEAGFAAIVYLAALSTIDPSLYEAADIDGCGKWRKMWHVSLPGIRAIVVLMLIISLGHVMEVGFDKVFVLQNATVTDISEVISTYIYRIGLQGAQFSLSSAMGLFESLVGLILVLLANWVARRYDQALF